jgi:hypothetical protein
MFFASTNVAPITSRTTPRGNVHTDGVGSATRPAETPQDGDTKERA